MIRVLHSVSNMDRAGIETMLMNYYRHIDRTKIQFDFLCNKSKPGAYDEEILSLGGRIFHTPGLNPLKYASYLGYMSELFEKHPEYKIVEAHNGALGVYALYAAKKFSIPVRIFHAHGASITRDLKYPLKAFCKSKISSCANQFYTCGVEAARCYFGNKVVENNDYILIPNAIEVGRFVFNQTARTILRKKHDLNGKHVIGHVGRFMQQKNHRFLLEVFKRILAADKDAFLVLLGDGQLMDKIKKYSEELNISDKVLFVGNVCNANEWYSAFDLFLLPSIWEGLPVVGVEAQAADLPCIFSASITREIGFSNKVSFISLENQDAWVKAALQGLKNKERKDGTELISAKGYNISFEAGKLQEKYINLFKSLSL